MFSYVNETIHYPIKIAVQEGNYAIINLIEKTGIGGFYEEILR